MYKISGLKNKSETSHTLFTNEQMYPLRYIFVDKVLKLFYNSSRNFLAILCMSPGYERLMFFKFQPE